MTESELREAFAIFCRKAVGGKSGELMLAEVEEVDREEMTCTVSDEGVEYFGVRLQPTIEGKSGVVLLPKVGAAVLLSQIEGGDWFVEMASEYDEISLKVGDSEVVIDKEGIVANGGELGGLIKIEKLIGWMQQVHSDLTTLSGKLASHVVVGNGNPLKLIFTPETKKPVRGDFEDERVKH